MRADRQRGPGGDVGAAPTVKKTKFEDDVIKTSGGDLKITSIAGYSVRFTYQGKVIDVDPVGRAADYSQLPKADVILVTHIGQAHGDPADGQVAQQGQHCAISMSTCVR